LHHNSTRICFKTKPLKKAAQRLLLATERSARMG